MSCNYYKGSSLNLELNTGVDLSGASSVLIKTDVNGTVASTDATLMDDDQTVTLKIILAASGRYRVWVNAIYSGTEKYIGCPYDFNVLEEGKL